MTNAVTIVAAGQVSGTLTRGDFLDHVVGELGQIPLSVSASAIDAPDAALNAASFGWIAYDYRLTITVARPDTTWTDDLIAYAVRGAIEDAAGSTPTAVQVTATNVAPVINAPVSSLPSLDVVAPVRDFVSGLQGELHGILLLVIGIIVLVVVALAWGPNIPSLATVHV